ncbi:uncharacterized protein LOC121979435 [Zingiber officinale]|uniref:uncharacterized protein LOC121979435 n=1 Tax=Zingiber officinale TaxID=94328 RepID=UPI001C4B386D|nr:uncharacterized protein LOC121979435 [Zingiber officinale]
MAIFFPSSSSLDAVFRALVDKKICLEEEPLLAKERELNAELNTTSTQASNAPLPELSTQPTLASSSYTTSRETSTSLPPLSKDAPLELPKQAPKTTPTRKCPRWRLTLTPLPKKRAISVLEDIPIGDIQSTSPEPTLSSLYPMLASPLIQPPKDPPIQSASLDPEFMMTFLEPIPLPNQGTQGPPILLFSPPSLHSSLSSSPTSSSTLPILLEGSLTTVWAEACQQLEKVTSAELADKFSFEETKWWVINMSVDCQLYDLSQENDTLRQQTLGVSSSHASRELAELCSQLQETHKLLETESKNLSKWKASAENFESQVKLDANLHSELSSKLDKYITENAQLSSQLQALKDAHALELTAKDSNLGSKDSELNLLHSSLTTAQANISSK